MWRIYPLGVFVAAILVIFGGLASGRPVSEDPPIIPTPEPGWITNTPDPTAEATASPFPVMALIDLCHREGGSQWLWLSLSDNGAAWHMANHPEDYVIDLLGHLTPGEPWDDTCGPTVARAWLPVVVANGE